MPSANLVVLIGNVTRDPELKTIPSGTAVCELGLAVNDRVKKGNEWVDEATFVDVTLFGKTAENAAQYLSKGSGVYVQGRLKLDQWEDKNGGGKRSKLRVVAEKLQFLGGGKGEAKRAPAQTSYTGSATAADDSDIPF